MQIKNKISQAILSFSSLKQLFLSGGVTFIFRIGGLGLNFLVTYFITYFFDDKALGNYILAFTLCQATAIIFALGMPNALISHLANKPIKHPFAQFMLRRGLFILVLVSAIPFLVYFFGSEFISLEIFNNSSLESYIVIAALTVPVMILHEFILYFFIATGNFMKFNIFMFIVPSLIFILLLLGFHDNPSYYTLVFYLLSITLVLITELFFALKQYTSIDNTTRISIKNIVTYSFPMMFSSIMLYLLNMTDVFMLGAMVNEQEVGYYSVAYKIASLSMLVIISMNVVLAPKIAELHKERDLLGMHKAVKKTTHLIITLTAPIVIMLVILSGFVLSIYGEEFLKAQTALIIIAVGFLFNAISGNVDQVLNMTGNQKILQYITIGGFISNILLNLVLIPIYGINGAAIASVFTNILVNYTCVIFIKKKLGFYTFI